MADHFERLKSALADRYGIDREIGRGIMAVVYLAEEGAGPQLQELLDAAVQALRRLSASGRENRLGRAAS